MDSTMFFNTTPLPGEELEASGHTEKSPMNMENITCESDSMEYEITELVFSAVSLPLHLFVLIAMIVHRDVVKRNVVNFYAANVIFSSVVGNIWRIIVLSGTLVSASQREITFEADLTNGRADKEDTFKTSLLLIMILVTSGSIGLVINAMRSIQFRVHRTVGGLANIGTEETCPVRNEKEKMTLTKKMRISLKNHPRMWAVFNISIIWIIPLLLIVFMVVFNSCEYVCHCIGESHPSEPFNETNCIDVNGTCSSFIPPISKLTLIVGFGTWIVYFVMLTILLAKTYKDLRLLTQQRRAGSTRILANDKAEQEVNNTELNGKESPNKKPPSTGSTQALSPHQPSPTKSTQSDQVSSDGKPQVKIQIIDDGGQASRRSGSIFIESLRKNFKLLLLMYIAYCIGTTPMAVVALMDGATGNLYERVKEGFVVLILLPMIAEFICTIMLCMYLSGVKSATRALAVKLGRCCQR